MDAFSQNPFFINSLMLLTVKLKFLKWAFPDRKSERDQSLRHAHALSLSRSLSRSLWEQTWEEARATTLQDRSGSRTVGTILEEGACCLKGIFLYF